MEDKLSKNADYPDNLKIVRDLDKQQWREFVENHHQGQIFHTPEMFDVFSLAGGHQPDLWAAVESDGKILTLFLPVQITLMNKWLRHFSLLTTRAVSYGNALCDAGGKGLWALDLLLKRYVELVDRKLLFTEFRNLSSTENTQTTLINHGFEYEEHMNYLIDLKRSPEDILKSISQRTRKYIKSGLRQGLVKIVEATTPEQVAICYELLQKTYRAAYVPLADRSLFDAAYRLLYPKQMIRFTLAYVGQNPVATSVDLLYKDVMYGWYGGLDRTYSRYMPNELLTWHILEWGAQNGFSVFDFGGAGRPGEDYGVRDFKAKFNGQTVNYGRNICIHAPNRLKLSKAVYFLARRIMSFRIRRPGYKDKALAQPE
jgi:serine/alanine adding enzyme